MLSGALSAQHVVRTDRAVLLAGDLRAPDDKATLGSRQSIEFLVQRALPQEDHAVCTAGGGGVHQVFVVSRRQVADREVAAAIARGLTDAGEQFEKERMRQRQRSSAHARCHDGDRAFSANRARWHVTTKFIAVFARQRPQLLFRRTADRRMIVERPRDGGDRDFCQARKLLERDRSAAFFFCRTHAMKSFTH